MALTKDQRKVCLYSQQGELDAVVMYLALAEKVKNPKEAETFKRLASEEGRHASVFHALTGETLKPNKAKAIAVPMMLKLCGKKFTYTIIANQEYAAAKKYEPVVKDFPQVQSVLEDEIRHGNTVKGLI